MPALAEHIEIFSKQIKVHGLFGPNLFAYLSQVVQFGGDNQEFWVVFDDMDEPIGFSCWVVQGLPHVAKVYMGFIHTWAKPGAATKLLGDEYMKFGDKHNAVWYTYDPVSERHYKVLERYLKARGHVLERTGTINCISRRAT